MRHHGIYHADLDGIVLTHALADAILVSLLPALISPLYLETAMWVFSDLVPKEEKEEGKKGCQGCEAVAALEFKTVAYAAGLRLRMWCIYYTTPITWGMHSYSNIAEE